MARVKLSEYRAKSLLVPDYNGYTLRLASLDDDIARLSDDQKYIIKVDQGIKKRGKQGLIRLNVTKTNARKAVEDLAGKGYEQFIAEPMFAHDDSEEQYLSLERTRDGIQILHSLEGGIEVENNADKIGQYNETTVPLPQDFIAHLIAVMDREHLSFVEINPLIIRDNQAHLLDAAILADSAGEYQASWQSSDITDAAHKTDAELAVQKMNENSPAAFTLKILNPDGALWLLLSGGGASITIADEAMNLKSADKIGNYGEYSGGPSEEETYLYTKEVLSLALQSGAARKAIIIAGGVANFTDISKTFSGIIKAIDEVKDRLVAARVKVFVRRGGPREKEGLTAMQRYLETNSLLGSIHGSETVLTDVIHEALEDINV